MKNRRVMCIFIAAAMISAAFVSGCSGKNEKETSADNSISASEAADNSEANGGDDITEPADVSAEGSEQEMQQSAVVDEDENKPLPEIIDPTPDNQGEYSNDIFIYNNVAYEPFYGGEGTAKAYAETVSYVKNKLGNAVTLYNVVVPTHTGVDLPDKFKDLFSSQEDYLNAIVSSYTADVKGVNAYSKIAHHRDEYLYFNSDHHWTALGAYYAYRAFTNVSGVKPVELSELKSDTIEDYIGSFEYFSGRDDLKVDQVTYYYPDYDIDCQVYDEYGNDPQDYMLLHTYASGSNSYGVFLGGDQSLIVTKNPNGNGKKIAVLKESYGNAFSPFISYTYSEAHLIDFRYAQFNLKTYLEQNGITDVIIINNSMASATEARLDELKAIVDSGSYEVPSDDDTSEDITDESYDDDTYDDNGDDDTYEDDIYDEEYEDDTYEDDAYYDDGYDDYTDDGGGYDDYYDEE